MPNKIAIAGHGGFAREVADWLLTRGVVAGRFLADNDVHCTPIDSYEPQDDEQVVLAIGDPRGRAEVFKRLLARKAVFHTVLLNIAPPHTNIGGGGIFMPGSVVSAHARVGDFVHANFYATIGHDAVIGDFCTLSSHVDICGRVHVGAGVFFGSGARVLPGVKIGEGARIGAGAVVMRDVPAGATIYAAPGKKL